MSGLRTAVVSVSAIVAAPIVAGLLFWGYLIFDSWQKREVVSEQTFENGEVLRVTQKATGPVGSGFAYELSHRSGKDADFVFVDSWEYPSGESAIDVHEIDELLIVLPPARNVAHIRSLAGYWAHWWFDKMIRAGHSNFANLLIASDQEPRVTVDGIDKDTRQIRLRVENYGWPPQHMVLEPTVRGDGIANAETRFTHDPRFDYATDFRLTGDASVLSIVRDLNSDGVSEVLLSHAEANNGNAGNIWSVYVVGQQGFRRLDDTLSMRTDAISSWSPRVSGADSLSKGITSYRPAGRSGGSLVTYAVEGDRIVTEVTTVDSTEESKSDYSIAMSPKWTVPFVSTPLKTLAAEKTEQP